MKSSALLNVVLNELNCTQAYIADKLKVSRAQVSKWKAGESMSDEMHIKLCELASLPHDCDPELILLVGGVEQSVKWIKLIEYLATLAKEGAETGYRTEPLEMPLGADFLACSVLDALSNAGATIPSIFPEELDFDYERLTDIDSDEWELKHQALERNPWSIIIEECFYALNDLYGFYAAFIHDEVYDLLDLDLATTPSSIENIPWGLIDLALAKVTPNYELCPKFDAFAFRTTANYTEWLEELKLLCFQNNIPLKAEVMHLVHKEHGAVGAEAESESLGFNSSKIHPDIYMDELLKGMRLIHQVLPAICKKLDISPDELNINRDELSSKG